MKAKLFNHLQQRLALVAIMLLGASNMLAQEYITDVMTIGAKKGKGTALKEEYRNKGWTVCDQDLNSGAGGWDVYIAYKTSSHADPEKGYITDICASNQWVDKFTFEGRTYQRASVNSGFNGDMNKGCGSGTADILIFFTRDHRNLHSYGNESRVMTALTTTSKSDDGDPNTAVVSWRNTSNYSGACDMNKDAGGADIFIQQHFTTQKLEWKGKPTFATNLTFNGWPQNLLVANQWNNNFGTPTYRVNGGKWSTTVPEATEVGNYTIDVYLDGTGFANNSDTISGTATINPPIAKANSLNGVFNQADKKVYLSWSAPSIPGNYTDFQWVLYRDGKKIAELAPSVRTYSDDGFTNEANPVYDLYYVSKFWDVTTKRDDTKASVTVSTVRTVPVNGVEVETLNDRIIFRWTSDAYPAGFGNKFRIFVGDEEAPIYVLTPADMQNSFRWEHRTTDAHSNRQNKVDPEGFPYTEEPLNACDPQDYRIEGVIGDKVLNTYEIDSKAIGDATLFYDLDATKGVHEGIVKLSWHVNRQGSDLPKTYIVERRQAEQEGEAWTMLTRISNTDEYLTYDDQTALPGLFYDYRVTIEDKCSDGAVISNQQTTIGFAKMSGTVTGRIAFGSSGTAVQGVEVVMRKNSSGDIDTDQFHSIYFTDVNGGVMWQYPSDDYAPEQFSSADFSIQMWLRPEEFNEGTVVDFGNGVGLRMTADGRLAFNDGTATHPFDGVTLLKDVYNHVVLTRSGQTITCHVLNIGESDVEPTVHSATLDKINAQWPMTGAKQLELGHFKGMVDEFRLWTKCLTEAEILENFDHLLVGNETQLETYWTFDEGLRTQFFDYSRNNTSYHHHHGSVGSNTKPSTVTPTSLALKAKTDANGNYVIQGIPFSGEGTTYSVVPMYGIHEFNPNRMLLFFNNKSLVHNNTDFEDVSSFIMSGHIHYAGTNVPADSVQLYIDGIVQTKDGAVVQTDANGYYELSVPIGRHFVEARRSGHTFVEGGRYPTQGTFHFDRRVQHDFIDSTLVNFVGRVGGGERNDTLAVGFAASKNNIGIATIQLAINNESLSLNTSDVERTWASDTTSINSSAWTGTKYDAKYIFIRTDSLTGEFSALLPPLRYKIKSIGIDNNPDIAFLSLPEINLTNCLQEYSDEILPEDRAPSLLIGPDKYKYNTKKIFTYWALPQIDVTEKVNGYTGAYGMQELLDYPIGTTDAPETVTISDIWKQEADGTISYLLGYPLYKKGATVNYELFGYEKYTNIDGDEPVDDIIPMHDQVITITNEMGEDQKVIYKVDDPSTGYQVGQVYDLESNTVTLDANGKVSYKWGVGLPNIISPFSRNVSIILERNDRTYVPFSLNAIVLGDLPEGNNFVTRGPDLVQFVLRDPPGAKSSTTLKRAVVNGTTEFSSDMAVGDHKLVFQNLVGEDFEAGAGWGFITIHHSKTYDETTLGTHATWRSGDSDETAWTTTYTQAISTGSAWPYVGSAGDVFVGTATNILTGKTRNLCIVRNSEGKYMLSVEDALSLGQEVTTTFNYSAYELENVMIPKWKDQRLAYLIEVPDSVTARNFVNNGKNSLYVTWVGKNLDTEYEKDVNYFVIPPKVVNENEMDSVGWCTQQIKSWQNVLADNEENKVNAMRSRTSNIAEPWNGWENFSIDGGSTRSYSVSQETSTVHKNQTTWYMGAILTEEFAFKIANFASWGIHTTIANEVGREQSDIDGEIHKNSMEWDYVLNEGNPDTDLSIDKYPSGLAGYSDVFSLFGGQTYNPYEGKEYTKWFEPGQHVLSNGSEQMEQPDIRISTDGVNSAKEATLTDVPAGQTGQFTLFLSNKNNANRHYDPIFQFMVPDTYNQKGLRIQMDGKPLSSGQNILVPQGETVQKVILVSQTDQGVLDYDSVSIRLASRYQPIEINDEVILHVHFNPGSSPIDLLVSEPVFNIETMDRTHGRLEMRLTNFDRQFRGMKKLGVEYRYEGSTSWAQPAELQFVVNEADSTTLGGKPLPAEGDLRLSFDMGDAISFPQGNYTFRAYTMTMYGNEPIYVYSKEAVVVKDNVAPTALTTPTPTNGILGYGDDMAVEFNEDIVPGYVSDKNVIITAKLNRQEVDHDVAKQLGGDTEQHTVNPIFLNGDFTVNFWMKWSEAGSILKHGRDRFAMTVDEAGHFGVSIGQAQFVSSKVLPKDEWVFLALNFKDNDMRLSAMAQHGTQTIQLFNSQEVDSVSLSTIVYSDDNNFYLGNMKGSIHDLCLYGIWRDLNDVAATKNQAKDGYVYGLMNYWPMNEGHGNVAADARHTHDFMVDGQWEIDNLNYAFALQNVNDATGVVANIARINTYREESYAIELWHKAAAASGTAEEGIFETDATPSNRLSLHYDAQKNLVLDYGTKSQTVATADVATYGDWHHLALNVVRGQSAIFYCDGKRTAVISEGDVPMLEGATMTFGKHSAGIVDEVRIWKATIQENRLLQNIYNTLDTTDVYSRGLVAYYPFEKDAVVFGEKTKVFTLDDMAPGQPRQSIQYAAAASQQESPAADIAPPLQNAILETKLDATPVASERKVVIRLRDTAGVSPRDMEGCLLNITVDKVNDMHGNQSDPIRWTAYVQKNTLKWAKDSVTVIKKFGDEYYFDVDIVNKGSKTEYYTLQNMPEWLSLVDAIDGSLVESTGDLAPQTSKTLRFLVKPLVAVGNYSVNVGLQGNDEILEPLSILMRVRGEAPNWTVNPDLYENNMSIVGQIYVNGVLMGNSESCVAAFIDGECRGVANIEPMRGAAFVALSVYGTAHQNVNGVITDLDNGKDVTFRIWDASKGITYTNVNITLPSADTPVTSVKFDNSATYGNFNNPVVFTKSNLIEQELRLRPNWNWISLGVEPVDTKTSVVFGDLTSWNVYIKDRSTGTYYSNGTYWDGSLTDVHANTMYKMNLSKLSKSIELPTPLPITGEPPKTDLAKVTLKNGWNWIGYLPAVAMTPDVALAGANPQEGDEVKSQQGFAFYGPYGWEGNLHILESGKGYLYHSVDPNTKQFSYPAVSMANAPLHSPAHSQRANEPSIFDPVEPETYPDNMSMVIKLVKEGEVVTDAELGAFVDNECRGAATASEDSGLYYLLIAGEGNGKPMEVRAAVNGSIVTVCTEVPYNSDAIIGTPWEPYVIDLDDVNGIRTLTVDEDNGRWYNIQGQVMGEKKPNASGVYIHRQANGTTKIFKKMK